MKIYYQVAVNNKDLITITKKIFKPTAILYDLHLWLLNLTEKFEISLFLLKWPLDGSECISIV